MTVEDFLESFVIYGTLVNIESHDNSMRHTFIWYGGDIVDTVSNCLVSEVILNGTSLDLIVN